MSVEEQSNTFTTTNTDDDPKTTLDAETLGTVFENARRRAVLKYLRTRDSAVELDELAEAVAAAEFETDCDKVPEDRYERVLVSLHHTHLPKLADAGFVSVDRTGGVHVTGNENAFEVLA